MKCFKYNKNNNLNCEVSNCRYWIDSKRSNNCCLNALQDKKYDESKVTLQDIGDIFKVTRMRICQVEKIALKKLRDKVVSNK